MSAFARTVGVSALSALLVLGLTRGRSRRPIDRPAHTGFVSTASGGRLVASHASYVVQLGLGRITAHAADASTSTSLDLSVVVDAAARPLALARFDPRPSKDGLTSDFTIDFEDGHVDATLVVALEPEDDALLLELDLHDPDHLAEHLGSHTVALGVDFATAGRPLFVSGRGDVADTLEASGRFVVLDEEPRPLGFSSRGGPLGLTARPSSSAHDPSREPGEVDPVLDRPPLHVALSSPALRAAGDARTDVRVVLGRSSQTVWGALARRAGVPAERLHGVVTGTRERARVYGLDGEGAPQIRATADANGRFDLEAPKDVTQWYAALDQARTSAPITFAPGLGYDLRLDVSPGGELHARVIDADTGQPITARLVVHGVEGTLDPSFGPDFRASGAGPLIDALRGDVTTPLPVGRYRVAATKGIEWTIDAKTIDIASGHTVSIDLAPRHVVPTPGVIGCDLHVHARPSFDTPVSVEDRVLSLVAAGVDFAVPTEHNLVGDYRGALASMDLNGELASVPGVEVTTFLPRLGHFGVFPYPTDKKVPPFKHTSIGAVFAAARRGDPNRVLVVHHPRLLNGIGYFELMHWKPPANGEPPRPPHMRTDFDALEVYNGYEMASQERVDLVLRDYYALLNLGFHYVATGSSDSHRIQYQWAGYPRTLVDVGSSADGPTSSLDTAAVVAAIKRGHATVSTGPIVDLDVPSPSGGSVAHPGDSLESASDELTAHVKVRAAPWIDLTDIEVVAGGHTVRTFPITSRPTKLGPELGTLEEAEARTVRFDQDVTVPLPSGNTWILVVARGTRKLDDVLPFMPIAPMGITNPVWITRPSR